MQEQQLLISSYQGIIFLLSGFLGFILIFSVHRNLGISKTSPLAINTNQEWIGTEELVVVDIIEETNDIKTFRLKRANDGPMPGFCAGQFLSFQIGKKEDKVLRSYSISSSAENHKTIDVSIKKIENGVGSNWFHQQKTGDKIIAYPPNGRFSPKKLDAPDANLVLIAGGIGITPMLSIIRTAIDNCSHQKMVLFYAARTQEDLAFDALLQYFARWHKSFAYFPILSRPKEGWQGLKGRLDLDTIATHVSNLTEYNYFFCGPEQMTENITEALIEKGVAIDNIHDEKFASPASMDESQFPEVEAKVAFAGQSLDYKGKKNLLEFLEDNEILIDFACRTGVCGNCKVKCVSGKVHSITDDGLTRMEKKEKYILSCVSRPQENIELTL